jgi:hypothetical protein
MRAGREGVSKRRKIPKNVDRDPMHAWTNGRMEGEPRTFVPRSRLQPGAQQFLLWKSPFDDIGP